MDDFYAARTADMAALPWSNIAPPFTDIPGSQNKPYIDKAMELEAELQTVLTAQIGKET